MKRFIKIIACLLALCTLVSTLSVMSFADSPSVIYTGKENVFVFEDDDDLFDGFKGLMPGDTVTQYITVKNTSNESDYVNIYMRAELHDDAENPMSEDVAEQMGTLASMHDFLSQLSMRVFIDNGDSDPNNDDMIYAASPNELDGLQNNVLIGAFEQDEEATLRVELDIPTSLGNEYQHAMGEVDWVFTVEDLTKDDSGDDDDDKPGDIGTLVQIRGNKYLDNELAVGSDYQFVLMSHVGTIMQKVSNNNGDIHFRPMFLTPGIHIYIIEEVAGDDENIIYDDTSIRVYIVINDDGTFEKMWFAKNYQNYSGFAFYNYTKSVEVEDPEEPSSEEEATEPEDDDEPVDAKDDVTSPLTGDDTSIVLWLALLVLGLVMIVLVIVFEKKKKKAE